MKQRNWEIITLAAILVFGLLLRVYDLGKPVFWIDEATSSIAAKEILEKGLPILDSGMLYSRSYFFHYIQAGFLFFGNNEFFARFPSVIFGLLTVFLAFKIGKEYSKTGGIISALFMAVFYLEVFFSRQARFYQLFQLAFFASLYFLYKSRENGKENRNYLYAALICFAVAFDTQIEALVLAPFFVIHILCFNKQKWLALLPAIPLVSQFFPALGLSASSTVSAVNYASDYYSFAYKMRYLLILFIPGVIWGFVKTSETSVSDGAQNSKNSDKKRLTLLLILPSLVALLGIFTLKTFALRYSYFFAFPLVLYSSLLLSFLYEKYGKIMIVTIIAVLLFPSNLFFPYSYVNVIMPVSVNLRDYSAPYTDYKNLPSDLVLKMRNSVLVSYFSSDVEWYVKKPDFALAYSMTGIGEDQISMINQEGIRVDRYSGAKIIEDKPDGKYYLTADSFSVSKLSARQKALHDLIIENCSVAYDSSDLNIYLC